MRRAKAQDHWRRLADRNGGPLSLNRFEFDSVAGLGKGSVSLDRSMTFLFGRNGVGKSTLMAAIGHLFGAAGNTTNMRRRVEGASLVCSGTWRGVGFEHSQGRPAALDKLDVRLVEPSAVTAIQRYFRDLTSDGVSSLVDAVERVPLSEEELGLVNYVLGRAYTRVEFAELDVEVAGLEEVPYFRAIVDGNTYGAEDMGLGEFAVLYLHWTLRRIPRGKGSLLLLEEPEAFVSPAAQRKLADVVAKYCDERKVCAIITTHSPAMLSNVPTCLLRVVRRRDGVTVVETAKESDYLETLDEIPGRRGFVLVEDVAARELLLRICDRHFERFRNAYSVVVCRDGVDQIASALGAFPRLRGLTVAGVLDGDMTGKCGTYGHWRAVALPGGKPPDLAIRQSVEAHASVFARHLGVELATLIDKIGLVAGVDHHDWAPSLAEFLGRTALEVISVGARVWVDHEGDAAEEFCRNLREALDTSDATEGACS